jgi:hypothetical protein
MQVVCMTPSTSQPSSHGCGPRRALPWASCTGEQEQEGNGSSEVISTHFLLHDTLHTTAKNHCATRLQLCLCRCLVVFSQVGLWFALTTDLALGTEITVRRSLGHPTAGSDLREEAGKVVTAAGLPGLPAIVHAPGSTKYEGVAPGEDAHEAGWVRGHPTHTCSQPSDCRATNRWQMR